VTIDWPALQAAWELAKADIAANTPLSAAAPLTGAETAQALTEAQDDLADLVALLAARQGYLTAAVRMLTALAEDGAPYASAAAALINALPGLAITANHWAPMVIGFLKTTQPAATGIQGDNHPPGQR
jgi:hypothetical protein